MLMSAVSPWGHGAVSVGEFFPLWDQTVHCSIVYMFSGTANANYQCNDKINQKKKKNKKKSPSGMSEVELLKPKKSEGENSIVLSQEICSHFPLSPGNFGIRRKLKHHRISKSSLGPPWVCHPEQGTGAASSSMKSSEPCGIFAKFWKPARPVAISMFLSVIYPVQCVSHLQEEGCHQLISVIAWSFPECCPPAT